MTTNTNLVPSEYPDFLGKRHPERPLPTGSVVDNNGISGVVVFDDGGDVIEVDWTDDSGVTYREEWVWDLADVMCTVVSVNKAKSTPKP
ncbi:MAG: hypothetical protein CTY38_01000 [Methylotenera sp.]|uniref:hypothetical protein n=1 Tax=Methylotenera sp. TaxID=2051956 RepID=UPI000D4D0FDB|nr:hypothetical protein [Methylotenera sp.]PPC84656.1 MAG: hypothetical protein CTY38_01000 [Methylotenera sp.]